jgi:hypothetical protein
MSIRGLHSMARLKGVELTLKALAELRLNILSVSVMPPFLLVAVPPPVLTVLALAPLM